MMAAMGQAVVIGYSAADGYLASHCPMCNARRPSQSVPCLDAHCNPKSKLVVQGVVTLDGRRSDS